MCAITPLWARAARHTLSRYSWMDDMAATLAGRSARGNPAPETRVRSLPCVVRPISLHFGPNWVLSIKKNKKIKWEGQLSGVLSGQCGLSISLRAPQRGHSRTARHADRARARCSEARSWDAQSLPFSAALSRSLARPRSRPCHPRPLPQQQQRERLRLWRHSRYFQRTTAALTRPLVEPRARRLS